VAGCHPVLLLCTPPTIPSNSYQAISARKAQPIPNQLITKPTQNPAHPQPNPLTTKPTKPQPHPPSTPQQLRGRPGVALQGARGERQGVRDGRVLRSGETGVLGWHGTRGVRTVADAICRAGMGCCYVIGGDGLVWCRVDPDHCRRLGAWLRKTEQPSHASIHPSIHPGGCSIHAPLRRPR